MCKMKTFLVVLMILSLAAVVPTAAGAAMEGPAARIRFQPGATSATVSGSLAPGGSARYVL